MTSSTRGRDAPAPMCRAKSVITGDRQRGGAVSAAQLTKGTAQMAAKTKTITVQNWRTTTFASGKRRVYATFESVKTVGGMRWAGNSPQGTAHVGMTHCGDWVLPRAARR